MRIHNLSFSSQLVLFSTLLVCMSVGAASLSLYQSTKANLEKTVERELLAIVRTSAPLIDANLVDLIYLDESGEIALEAEFQELQSQLRIIRDSNDLMEHRNPIYIMRSTPQFETTGMLEFVAMIDRDATGEFFVGNRYPAEPHNRAALRGISSSSGVYFDDEGAWISASAPLRNSDLEIVGVLQVDRPIEQYLAVAKQRALAILRVAFVSILGAVVLAVLFARRLTAPLRSITEAAKALSRGELSRRLTIARDDEIGELAAGFNKMAENLEFQTQKMIVAVKNAKVASRAKSDFLSNMSHEIRTPLTAIVGYADLLGRTGQSKQDRRLWTDYLKRSSDHLLSLVNDILDLSKIEAGKMEILSEPTSIYEIVMQVNSMMEPMAQEKLLDLTVECRGLIPREFNSDSVRIRQILINLVGNAIKFTDAGHISIDLFCTTSSFDGHSILNIAINDTGIGIEQDQLSEIFQPFTQVTNQGAGREGGTGLGLDISSRMAKMLQGDLSATSEPDVGSSFVLKIDLGVGDDLEWVTESGLVRAVREVVVGETVDDRLSGASILIVEDGEHNRRILEFLMTEEGANVTTENDGVDGVAVVLQADVSGKPFDLIMMDMQMPRKDGYEAVREIREHGIDTPIVAITAYALARDRDRCLACGCDDYVAKPFVPSDLLKVVQRHLQRSSPRAPTERPAALPQREDGVLRSTMAKDRRYSRFLKILEPYVASLPELIEQIEMFTEQDRHEDLTRIIHQLKGSAGGFGFPSISDRAEVVMNRLRDGDSISKVESDIKELLNLMRSVRLEHA